MKPVNELGLTLESFLADYDPCHYERPSVTVDIIVLTHEGQVLLIKRKNYPNIGCWAFPGGFIGMDEVLDCAAKRELFEETGLKDIELDFLGTYGEPSRDPRLRIITCAFLARVPADSLKFRAGDDAADASLFSVECRYACRCAIPPKTERRHMVSLPAAAVSVPYGGFCESYEIILRSLKGPENVLGVRCGKDEKGRSLLLGSMDGLETVAGDHGLLLFDVLRKCHMLPVSFNDLKKAAKSVLKDRKKAAALWGSNGLIYTGAEAKGIVSAENAAVSAMFTAGESTAKKLLVLDKNGLCSPDASLLLRLSKNNEQCVVLTEKGEKVLAFL